MIYLPRYPQIIAGLSHVSQQFLVLLLHEAHLSDGECEEEVSSESVGVEGEAVVDEGGAEPEVVADQGLLSEVGPHEQLNEPVTLLALTLDIIYQNKELLKSSIYFC